MASLGEFRRRIGRIADSVEEAGGQALRECSLAIDQTVVMATPVDTGTARSNWQVEVGSAPEGVVGAFAPGEGGSTGAANASAAIAQGQATIAQAKAGDEVHITNNLPYIEPLNQGHSAQAPEGFVEEAIQVGVTAIRGVRFVRS